MHIKLVATEIRLTRKKQMNESLKREIFIQREAVHMEEHMIHESG